MKVKIEGMLKDSKQIEIVWCTLLALFILNEKYSENEDEWVLIAKKAKNFLSNSLNIEVKEVNGLIKKLSAKLEIS